MRKTLTILKHALLAILGLAALIAPYVAHRLALPLALIFGLLVVTERSALAWGEAGHIVVAEIADRHLTKPAAHAVLDLLDLEHETTLAQVANWADDPEKKRHPNTKLWHYVDIPITAPSYEPRYCPDGNCIVAKIAEYRATLANKAALPADRLEALKFLVHFIGDLHQPLHCADNGDDGGNTEPTVGFSGARTLHAVWDMGIIKKGHLNELEVPAKLNGKITAADATLWAKGSVVDWANESHAIAVTFIYTHKPNPTTHRLPTGYQDEAEPKVELQLEKAGIRLAAVLNEALK